MHATPICSPAPTQVLELLLPIVADTDAPLEAAAYAALSLGLVFVGSCHDDICQSIIGVLMERSRASLEADSLSRLFCVGAGLLYLGKQSAVDITLELSRTLEGPLGLYCERTLETCAYMGSGNVLKVQQMMNAISEHQEAVAAADDSAPDGAEAAPAAAGGGAQGTAAASGSSWAGGGASAAKDKDKEGQLFDAASLSAMGVAFIAMGEELGGQMAQRALGHMLQYGDVSVRRGVPLAAVLLSVSNPEQSAVDLLSKLTHDNDTATATSAIIALGLCGAGTNNSRVANNLRSLASYYSKDASMLFAVRIAQGLLHAGKGLLGFNPFHSNRALFSPTAGAAIVAFVHTVLDFKGLVLGKHHSLLYLILAAAQPRMLITLDEVRPAP